MGESKPRLTSAEKWPDGAVCAGVLITAVDTLLPGRLGLGWQESEFMAQKGHWMYFWSSEAHDAYLVHIQPIIKAADNRDLHVPA